jgi:hypothetical protein
MMTIVITAAFAAVAVTFAVVLPGDAAAGEPDPL